MQNYPNPRLVISIDYELPAMHPRTNLTDL
jgi:hypothetical protein